MNRYMAFTVNGLELGIDMAAVVSMEKNSFGPLKNRRAAGPDVYFYNGEPIPLWQLSNLFDKDGEPLVEKRDSTVLVIRSRNGLLGLCIDGAGTIFKTDEVRIVTMPPVFGGKTMTFCPHVLHSQGKLFPIINPEEIDNLALTHLDETVQEEPPTDDFPTIQPDGELLPEIKIGPMDEIDSPETDIVTPERLKAGITCVLEKKVKQRLKQLISHSFDTLASQTDLPDGEGKWTK